MEKQEETMEDSRGTCALVLLGTLRQFANLKQYAETIGMQVVYRRETAPWIRLYIATEKEILNWRDEP